MVNYNVDNAIHEKNLYPFHGFFHLWLGPVSENSNCQHGKVAKFEMKWFVEN